MNIMASLVNLSMLGVPPAIFLRTDPAAARALPTLLMPIAQSYSQPPIGVRYCNNRPGPRTWTVRRRPVPPVRANQIRLHPRIDDCRSKPMKWAILNPILLLS